jgi:ElaB/YqjD/DUF883 family membrane-anchored ribosome-binding protein
MGADIAEGFGEAERYVERKGSAAEARLEGAIPTHPMMAIGLAALTGVFAGALTRR